MSCLEIITFWAKFKFLIWVVFNMNLRKCGENSTHNIYNISQVLSLFFSFTVSFYFPNFSFIYKADKLFSIKLLAIYYSGEYFELIVYCVIEISLKVGFVYRRDKYHGLFSLSGPMDGLDLTGKFVSSFCELIYFLLSLLTWVIKS